MTAQGTARRAGMSWIGAGSRAVAIFIYFAIATVWLPSAIAKSGPIVDAADWIGDLVVASVWAVGLAVGMWALRRAQDRGFI